MSRRLQVTRSERYDVAEWVEGPSPQGGDDPRPPPPEPFFSGPRLFAIVASLLIVVATVVLIGRAGRPQPEGRPLAPTTADLSAVHAGVTVGGAEIRRLTRLHPGDVIETDADGSARLRLDDGTTAVIDRDTRLTLTGAGIDLARGRVFVQGAPGGRAEIVLGGVTALLSDADAAVERGRTDPASARVYAPRAELTLRSAKGEEPLRSGETAVVSGEKIEIGPERGFDDWTGGLSAPWGARGAPRRAVGELWGRPGVDGEIGAPLTLRAHDIRATITGELAETEARSTFFNGGSEEVIGDFRMALPPGAIVSGFASLRGEYLSEGFPSLAERGKETPVARSEMLEWAGDGWVRGALPNIQPGATVTVIVRYVEWLSPVRREGSTTSVVQYRYPLAGEATPPQIGEFSARIDASPSRPRSVGAGFAASAGALSGAASPESAVATSSPIVELRRPDFRPTADLVVEVELAPWEAPARLYVASGEPDDEAGDTLLIRTELPETLAAPASREGVTLALLLDTSSSIDPALLDAERALASAIVGGMSARDRVVVIAADADARPVGPAALGPADPERRKAITEALAALTPGGATDLGRALEAAADALPADAPAAMVIYLGDGWPTVGDDSADEIAARLSRRPGGAPRLGAVAVGPLANRAALAALTHGTGPLLEMADAADAPEVSVALLAEALRPAAAGVEIDLGPDVERVYPRVARAIPHGDTVVAVGRTRVAPPQQITLRWRDAAGAHEERRNVTLLPARREDDIRRRWAAARVEEIALRNRGREAATDVALRAGLLTPWTALVTGGGPSTASNVRTHVPTPLRSRILDLASDPEAAGLSAALATPRGAAGALTDVLDALDPSDTDDADAGDDTYKAAVATAARRTLTEASSAVRACRDSRAALRPDLSGNLTASLKIDGEGRAEDIAVRGSGASNDEALLRCVEVVIAGLSFPASGLRETISVNIVLSLPEPRATLRGRRCSPTSTIPLPLRRGVWQERITRTLRKYPAYEGAAQTAAEVYLTARQACELPTWSDRRALLELILNQREDVDYHVGTARELDRAGDADAATLVRREAARRARSPEDLRRLRAALIRDETYPAKAFQKSYDAARGDDGRLAVVRRFLQLAPHDARLRLRLLRLLEALGKKDELTEEVRRLRRDPFAEATLLAEGASALRRVGHETEARRAFGELSERAPRDPWARAFLGDRLRNEGWFNEATAAYATLEELAPGDPAALLRLGLAHAGAGRLDVALRMLSRVAQTGGRTGNAELGDLSGRVAQVLIAEARGRAGTPPEDGARLARAALELPFPPAATLVLVRAPSGTAPVKAELLRGTGAARKEEPADLTAPTIGLASLRIEPGETAETTVRLRRAKDLPPAPPVRVRVDALVPRAPGTAPGLVSTEVDLPVNGDPVDLRWTSERWEAPRP
ncbi:VWA domain-containing protein [Chondromyces apiculatus]|uniref:VWFA domain-containing protein n=1 Tax=Chondromyces apiculatus DSM 436 TaxID=1192034 RepID=A0A017TDN4_9BACT|nr:VWA domain-containing protein [Chondromyces apiculatus]EYF07017.1 Hypothetical protein CAP_1276 [Chondromyces apiculatus DSM 436]